MSLKFRIAVVIFVLETVMMAAVLWETLGLAIESSEHQIKETEQAAVDIVSNIGRIALLDEDYDRIQGYIQDLPKNPNIIKAQLSDERNIIVASSTYPDLGEKLSTLQDTDTAHWRTLEITNPSGRLGMLAVLFSDEARLATYREALKRGITIAAIGMTLIAIFGIGFGYLLTLRLNRLVHATREVAQGNYDVRTGLRGNDEIAQVGSAFDEMTCVIAEERKALAEANLELDRRVKARTQDLEEANREYKAFAHAISHDLRAPLRSLSGFSQALCEDYAEQLDETARDYLIRIKTSSEHMGELLEGLSRLSRISQADLDDETVDLSSLCHELVNELRNHEPNRNVTVDIQADVLAGGDRHLLNDALANLIGNAWKFTAHTPNARIQFGAKKENGGTVYFIKDNGAGFDQAFADKVFTPFKRLHDNSDFPGTGIGLSTVQRIIQRHGGSIWAQAEPGQGATFQFTLGNTRPATETAPATAPAAHFTETS